jgi:class 3 adenylate cyclase
MERVADWLKELGMSEYIDRFVENHIDESIIRELTDQDLKDLGVVSLGHRRKMLRAIRDLSSASAAVTAPAATEPTRRDDAERRQLTVMFTDLVASTALSSKLDPEDLRSVIGAYHKCVAETVARFGGQVHGRRRAGVFRLSEGHEDDAERAARTGLALMEALGKLPVQERLQARIGVPAGMVVVGDPVGSGEKSECGVVGNTRNLAARLQGVAAPNTVVIAEGTRQLIRNLFELEDLGPAALKGIAGPTLACVKSRRHRRLLGQISLRIANLGNHNFSLRLTLSDLRNLFSWLWSLRSFYTARVKRRPSPVPQKVLRRPSGSRDNRAAWRRRCLSEIPRSTVCEGPAAAFTAPASPLLVFLSSLLFFDSCHPMIFQPRGAARC